MLPFFKDTTRDMREYIRCDVCSLVFVPPQYLLNPDDEKARYDTHKNSEDNPGYMEFLAQMSDPLLTLLSEKSSGLDFGCGPGPCLSKHFERQGHTVDLYDVFYEDNQDVFNKTYDFVTTTEVVEHLYQPGEVLDRVWNLVKPGGYLGVMTQPIPENFDTWWYKKDNTHVSFFHTKTFEYLMKKWGATQVYQYKAVWILKKAT
jgi:hypothetical protein